MRPTFNVLSIVNDQTMLLEQSNKSASKPDHWKAMPVPIAAVYAYSSTVARALVYESCYHKLQPRRIRWVWLEHSNWSVL